MVPLISFAYTHTRGPLTGKQQKPLNALPGGDLMDTDLACRIIDELAAAGARSITWTGGGEPTLHPDFDEIVSYADGKVAQGLYTHGGHITPPRAALLKPTLSWVYVSLDAADQDSYKAAKGVNRFQHACDGIRALAAAPGGATIGVGYLVTEDNWQAADIAVDVASRLGADYIQFRPTVRYAPSSPQLVVEDTGWLAQAVPWLEEVASAQPEFVLLDTERFRAYQDWSGHPFRRCYWAGLQTVITPNGKVWVCANKREHADAALGDLSVESFQEVWSRRRLPDVDGQCRAMCRGYLPNVALNEMLKSREHPEFI
jgi:MoaA/NifB/PqqE/SkfB family radical SAM enzyme